MRLKGTRNAWPQSGRAIPIHATMLMLIMPPKVFSIAIFSVMCSDAFAATGTEIPTQPVVRASTNRVVVATPPGTAPAFSRPASSFSPQFGTFSRPEGTFSRPESTFSRPQRIFERPSSTFERPAGGTFEREQGTFQRPAYVRLRPPTIIVEPIVITAPSAVTDGATEPQQPAPAAQVPTPAPAKAVVLDLPPGAVIRKPATPPP